MVKNKCCTVDGYQAWTEFYLLTLTAVMFKTSSKFGVYYFDNTLASQFHIISILSETQLFSLTRNHLDPHNSWVVLNLWVRKV